MIAAAAAGGCCSAGGEEEEDEEEEEEEEEEDEAATSQHVRYTAGDSRQQRGGGMSLRDGVFAKRNEKGTRRNGSVALGNTQINARRGHTGSPSLDNIRLLRHSKLL